MKRQRDVEPIRAPDRAALLLQHPVRRRILGLAHEPISATQLAGALHQPRQRINYHVRQLERGGYLKPAGRRMRRNLEERQYQATARSYVLAPELLGELTARPESSVDALSAAHLLSLATQAQSELADVVEASADAGVRVLTLSIAAELRFETAAQRGAFGAALTAAVTEVVARHSSPFERPDGSPGAGQPFRLLVGCYPKPATRGPIEEGADVDG